MNFNIISIIRASYEYSELKKGEKLSVKTPKAAAAAGSSFLCKI